ncbi:MAG: hypothetical protein MJZ13_02395 [Bacteroidales bacterium]|nr:hypothetical protein [Bacteroidales bacterium]
MNKILPIAAVVLTLNACQDKEPNILDKTQMDFGWSSDYDPQTSHIVFNDAWSGRGWLAGDEEDKNAFYDLSNYDLVVVDLKDIEGPVSKLNLIVRYVTEGNESRDVSTIVNGATSLKVKLNEEYKNKVKSIFLLCDTICEMTVKDAYLDRVHTYGERKELKMSDIGIISSDQFEGYSDKALVEFTFETTGDMMGVNQYGENVDMRGWGVGIICSAADIMGAELPSRSIIFRNLGRQAYVCELSDLRYLLTLKDDDGECGIYWTVWKIGQLTEAKIISTTIAEAID